MFGPQVWCFLSQLLPTKTLKTVEGTKSTQSQQWALWRNRKTVMVMVGWKKKAIAPRAGLKSCLKLDRLWARWTSYWVTTGGPMWKSDTNVAPATLMRIDHIVDNFYCTRCLSSFDSTVMTKSFVLFQDSFHIECTWSEWYEMWTPFEESTNCVGQYSQSYIFHAVSK